MASQIDRPQVGALKELNINTGAQSESLFKISLLRGISFIQFNDS